MYGFKVVVTTLVIVLMFVIACAVYKSPGTQAGRYIACILIIINALSVVAIWG